ncbi:MAG: DUF362 domain-containing protein [Candidatus Helarchaeota archaeon]
MQERLGKILYRCWNYEIRKDGKDYYGYENDITSKRELKSFVYIHEIKKPRIKSMAQAMDKVGLKKIIKPSNRVAIKVNLCGGFPGIMASQTPLKGVEGLLDYLLSFMDNDHIFLAEANNWGHVVDDRLLKKRGYYQLCKEKNVKFLQLSYTPTVKFFFKGFHEPVLLSMHLLHPNMKIINFAPIKHHWECGVTLAAKNLYGAISDESKTKFHDYTSGNALDHLIAACARVHDPDLNILGGPCVCAGQGPHFCRPTKFNYYIISNDFLASDKIGADVLGFPYELVAHAQINEKYGVWNSNAPHIPGSATIPEEIKKSIAKYVIPPEVVMKNRVGLKFIYKTNKDLLRSLRYFEFVIPIVNWIFYGRRGNCNMRFKDE